ncbi:hypothetical protein MHYP_G00065330 [Metynnis hypsauchen]
MSLTNQIRSCAVNLQSGLSARGRVRLLREPMRFDFSNHRRFIELHPDGGRWVFSSALSTSAADHLSLCSGSKGKVGGKPESLADVLLKARSKKLYSAWLASKCKMQLGYNVFKQLANGGFPGSHCSAGVSAAICSFLVHQFSSLPSLSTHMAVDTACLSLACPTWVCLSKVKGSLWLRPLAAQGTAIELTERLAWLLFHHDF